MGPSCGSIGKAVDLYALHAPRDCSVSSILTRRVGLFSRTEDGLSTRLLLSLFHFEPIQH